MVFFMVKLSGTLKGGRGTARPENLALRWTAHLTRTIMGPQRSADDFVPTDFRHLLPMSYRDRPAAHAMIFDAAHLLIAAACVSSFICASHSAVSSTKGTFISYFATSQRLRPRSRRQALLFDEFGVPRYSRSQGSTIFQVARGAVGIPGSFLGSTNIFGNESPLLEKNALAATTEQPRYGPNHPPLGAYTIPPRYSATSLPTNNVNLNSETLSSKTEQNASRVVLPPDSLLITDRVTESPASLPKSSTLPSDDLTTVSERQLTSEWTGGGGLELFIPTKPSIPFALTIDPRTSSGPSNVTEQPSPQTSISITTTAAAAAAVAAAPVASASSGECFCPCLAAAATYAPAKVAYTAPPPAPFEPSVISQTAPATSYFPPPPPLRPSFTDVLAPLQQPRSPALVFGPAPPRGSAGPVLTQFLTPVDGQVGHPEPPPPPPFQGDNNALEQPLIQGQSIPGFVPPRQFGIAQFPEIGHPEPPSGQLRHFASHLKSSGTFLYASAITSYLSVLLFLRHFRLHL